MALWIPSLLMSAAEAVLSGYCCVAALTLRGVGPCRKEGLQRQVRTMNKKGSIQKMLNCIIQSQSTNYTPLLQLEELTELEHPKCKRQDNEQLLVQNQEIQASQKGWA